MSSSAWTVDASSDWIDEAIEVRSPERWSNSAPDEAERLALLQEWATADYHWWKR